MSANWSSAPRRGHPRAPIALALQQEMPGNWGIVPPYAAGATHFPAMLSRLAIGLLVAATIVIALINPSGAQTAPTRDDSTVLPHDRSLFEKCLQDWDRATHMTKSEWAGACRRLIRDHEDPAQVTRL